MQLERKRSHHAEISATAANGPEQVGIVIRIRLYKFPIGQHDIRREEIVDGESALAGEVPDASAEGQSTNSGGRNNSAGSGKPKHVRGMIDVAPCASAADGDGARCRINARVFYRSEIDDQAVITNSQASRVVSAAADSEKQTLFPRKIYRLNYVRYVGAACYHTRLFVNHPVVHFAGVIVSFVARLDYRASQI